MNDARLLEWILDENTEDAVCGSSLAEIAPPDALVQHTLSLVDAEWETRSRGNWRVAGVTLALAAGVLLAIRLPQPAPDTNPTERMTPKGLESSAPEISLKMAVDTQGRLQRVESGARYGAGDQLYFRVSSSGAGWVYLVYENKERFEVLATQQVAAGETDLGAEQTLLSWTIDAGDPDSRFAVIGSNEPIDPTILATSLQPGRENSVEQSGKQTCQLARTMGWSCDLQAIEVAQ